MTGQIFVVFGDAFCCGNQPCEATAKMCQDGLSNIVTVGHLVDERDQMVIDLMRGETPGDQHFGKDRAQGTAAFGAFDQGQ